MDDKSIIKLSIILNFCFKSHVFFLFLITTNAHSMSFLQIQKKIRVKGDSLILIINAPKTYTELVATLKFDTEMEISKLGKYDFIQIFVYQKSELEQLVNKYSVLGKYDCLLWFCYPKVGGMIKSDLNRNEIWKIVDQIGMKCVTQIAIDETWSALRIRPKDKVGKK